MKIRYVKELIVNDVVSPEYMVIWGKINVIDSIEDSLTATYQHHFHRMERKLPLPSPPLPSPPLPSPLSLQNNDYISLSSDIAKHY